MRVGSVATRAQISPTRRPYHDHQAYCFFLVEGTCGQCVDRWRLPGGAGAADPPPAGDRMDDPRWLDARSEPSARFLDPLVKLAGGLCADAAGGLAGNWLFVLTSLVVLCLNVLGEELWWRDYILPRQELAIGRRAWLMHGLLWTAFHAAMWWNLLNLLPLALGLAFVTVRRESTKTGIVTHVFQKLDYFVMTLPLFLSVLEVP